MDESYTPFGEDYMPFEEPPKKPPPPAPKKPRNKNNVAELPPPPRILLTPVSPGDYHFQTELLDVWPKKDEEPGLLLRVDHIENIDLIIDPLDEELALVPLTIAKISKLFGVAEFSVNHARLLDSSSQAMTKHVIHGGYLHLDEGMAQAKGRKYDGNNDVQEENTEREATIAYKSHNSTVAINLPFDAWKQSMFNEDALTANAMTLKRWFFSQERDGWYIKLKDANWYTKSKWFMCYLNSDEGREQWNDVHPYLVLYWPYMLCFQMGYWSWRTPKMYKDAKNKNLAWQQLAASNTHLVYKMLPEGRYTNTKNELLNHPEDRALAAEMMDTNETVTANDLQGDTDEANRNDKLTLIFDPVEPTTWTGLGWLNKYNISSFQPLYPGPGQFETTGKETSYKSRYGIRKQYVQYYFYTQLYHRNGIVSQQSLKYALATYPRMRHEKDMDPDHWTQDGAIKRVKRPAKAAGDKWIADPNDTEHYSTYDHTPFRADMLYAGTSMQFGGKMQEGTHRGISMNLDAIPEAANWILSYQKYTPFGEAVMTKRLDGSDTVSSDLKHRTTLLEAYCKILALGSLPTPGRMHPKYFFEGTGKHCLGKMSGASDSKMRLDVKDALDKTQSTLQMDMVYDDSTPLEELMEQLSLFTEEERQQVKVGKKGTLATMFNKYEAGRSCTNVDHEWKAVATGSNIRKDELPQPNWDGDASQSPIRLLAHQLGLSVEGLHTTRGMTKDDLDAWNAALPRSEMTVYEFITSPYNLVHLPYRTVTYQFNIGEFWSPVCKRCVRPFYENRYIAVPFGAMSGDAIMMGVRGRKIASNDQKIDIDCEQTAEDLFDDDKARKKAEIKRKKDEPYNVINLRQFIDPLTKKLSSYNQIPDILYRDPTGKRNTVYTLQYNVHHQDVSGVTTVDGLGKHDNHDRVWHRGDIPKGASEDIPNGYIRQTDWRTETISKDNPDGYVYKFNRFTNPFCKHLRLKRQHPQGNLCTDCYIELGGEGRMGMDLIERLNAKPNTNAPAPKKRDYVFTRQNDPRDVPRQIAASTTRTENVGEEVQNAAETKFDCAVIPCEEQIKRFKESENDAYQIVVDQCKKIDVDPHQILLSIAGMSMIQWAHEKEAQAPSIWMTEGECELDGEGNVAYCVLNEGLVDYFDMAKLKALKMVRRRDRVMESNGVTWKREQPSLKDTLDIPDPAAKSKRIEMDFQDYPEQIKSREELKVKLMADKSRVSKVTDLLDKIKDGGFDNQALNTELVSILLEMDDTVKKALEHYGSVIARRVKGDYDLHGNKMFDRYFSRVEYVKPKYRLIVHDKLVQEFRKLKIPGEERNEEDDDGKKYWAFDKSPDGSKDVIRLNHNRITGEDGKLIQPNLDDNTFQKQIRPMRMSHIMITYVLHHRALHTSHNRYVMHQMAAAASHIFKHPHILEQMIRFGQRVMKGGGRSLIVRRKNANDLYDNYTDTYPYDEFATHMHYTEVDGGIEIAPVTGFFHWHIMLKMVHFSKLMFDYLQMRNWLELSFKGLHAEPEDNFVIWDHDGSLFYKDTDVPYIDVRLHAQDDWDEVIKSYMHKSEDAIIEQVRRADVKNPIHS